MDDMLEIIKSHDSNTFTWVLVSCVPGKSLRCSGSMLPVLFQLCLVEVDILLIMTGCTFSLEFTMGWLLTILRLC